MTVKTASEIRKMERAGKLAAEALQHAGSYVAPGITTEELDQIANDFILSRGAKSACIGYHGYPKATCVSVNEVICHGLPGNRVLQDGDIVNIDVTVLLEDFHGDTSAMFLVGNVSESKRQLCDVAKGAMEKGISVIRPGATTGDIGFHIEKYVTRKGYYPVKEAGGHGIGRDFHEDPFVPSFGKKGKGISLVKWGAITVEPMVNETSAPIKESKIPGSSITIIETSDGHPSAQYEHTVLITDRGYEILTQI